MAKKTTNHVPSAGKSKVWDASLPKGVQHTIYAPSIFFELWVGDESPLKKVVNDFLLEHQAANPKAKPVAKAQPVKAPADFEPVSDDDI